MDRSRFVLVLTAALLGLAVSSPVARASDAYLGQGSVESALAQTESSARYLPDPAYPGVIHFATADFAAEPLPNLTLMKPGLAVLRFERPMTEVTAVYTVGTAVTDAHATQIDPNHWTVDLSGALATGAALRVKTAGGPDAVLARWHNTYEATMLPTPIDATITALRVRGRSVAATLRAPAGTTFSAFVKSGGRRVSDRVNGTVARISTLRLTLAQRVARAVGQALLVIDVTAAGRTQRIARPLKQLSGPPRR